MSQCSGVIASVVALCLAGSAWGRPEVVAVQVTERREVDPSPGYGLHVGPGLEQLMGRVEIASPVVAASPESRAPHVTPAVLLDPRYHIYVQAPGAASPGLLTPLRRPMAADPCRQPAALAMPAPPVGPNMDGQFFSHPSFPGRPLYWNWRLRTWAYRDDRSPSGWFAVPLEANVPPPR